ncbi:RPA-interacting protein A-like [Stegodyphus dumicola]|uniref:RPA-interacting protein A-like n=1 Tax=Stegodyphus dumicola TaxID=202533 RepID=UPI0015B13203|nr:RPA-interacting protein A-like [Stegodyphus dumicola]
MLLEKEYAQNEELRSLESAVNWLEKEEVICPICKKCPLHQLHSVIFCQCGLEIDTKQDGLTLLNLKEELYRGLETHDKSCSVIPTFLLLQYCDVKNLTITCEVCNFMYIVI